MSSDGQSHELPEKIPEKALVQEESVKAAKKRNLKKKLSPFESLLLKKLVPVVLCSDGSEGQRRAERERR